MGFAFSIKKKDGAVHELTNLEQSNSQILPVKI